MATFVTYQPGYRSPFFAGEGKSGQHRAAHRLTAGSAGPKSGGKKVPQKITVLVLQPG